MPGSREERLCAELGRGASDHVPATLEKEGVERVMRWQPQAWGFAKGGLRAHRGLAPLCWAVHDDEPRLLEDQQQNMVLRRERTGGKGWLAWPQPSDLRRAVLWNRGVGSSSPKSQARKSRFLFGQRQGGFREKEDTFPTVYSVQPGSGGRRPEPLARRWAALKLASSFSLSLTF